MCERRKKNSRIKPLAIVKTNKNLVKTVLKTQRCLLYMYNVRQRSSISSCDLLISVNRERLVLDLFSFWYNDREEMTDLANISLRSNSVENEDYRRLCDAPCPEVKETKTVFSLLAPPVARLVSRGKSNGWGKNKIKISDARLDDGRTVVIMTDNKLWLNIYFCSDYTCFD